MDRPLGSARRYAAALLSLAGEGAAAETIAADLDRVAEVVAIRAAMTATAVNFICLIFIIITSFIKVHIKLNSMS